MRYGYAVYFHSCEREVEAQKAALFGAAAQTITWESAASPRAALDRLVSGIEAGDTIVAVSLDRFALNAAHLERTVRAIRRAGGRLEFVQSPHRGADLVPLYTWLFRSLRGLEHDKGTAYQRAGQRAAQDKGKLGRPRKLSEDEARVAAMLYQGGLSQAEAGEVLGVSRSTVQRIWRRHVAEREGAS